MIKKELGEGYGSSAEWGTKVWEKWGMEKFMWGLQDMGEGNEMPGKTGSM